MTLSKKNLDQLNDFLKKESNIDKSHNNISDSNKYSFFKTNSSKASNPSDIFYSIIDNSEHLEDTTVTNNELKESEEKLIKEKKYNALNKQIKSQRNNQLSQHELLYDEFNYLLEDE
tara:strand:- start:1119 stop:1469 length:351 start_codon:yes stop_codon:yes gene_type:complete